MYRGQYCRLRNGGLGMYCLLLAGDGCCRTAGACLSPGSTLDSRQWHIQSASGNGGPTCWASRCHEGPILVIHEGPMLVIGVIGPRSPTGLVGHKLTSCMLFVRPSTGSERRDVASSMQFVSHTIPFVIKRL